MPDPHVECPSRTQTQVNWLTFNLHSHTSPIRLAAQALIIGLGLHSMYDLMTPLQPTYVGNPIDINPDPTQFTLAASLLGNHTNSRSYNTSTCSRNPCQTPAFDVASLSSATSSTPRTRKIYTPKSKSFGLMGRIHGFDWMPYGSKTLIP